MWIVEAIQSNRHVLMAVAVIQSSHQHVIFNDFEKTQTLPKPLLKYLVIPYASTLVQRCTSGINDAFASGQRGALGPQEVPEAQHCAANKVQERKIGRH